MAEATTTQVEAVDQIGFQHLNAVDVLFLVRDVVTVLDQSGIIMIGADGHGYVPKLTPVQVEQAAPKIEALLKQHGMTIPSQVDVVISSLPLLLPLLGVK